MSNKAENHSTEAALNFLCKRNPLDCEQWQFVAMLMEFQDTHGDKAVQALAGFYLWVIRNKQGEECSHIIASTFAHDFNGRKDKTMLPRSSSYLEVWTEEHQKYAA